MLETAEESSNFLAESSIIQQIIVMLITGLETYLEKRYIELCVDAEVSREDIAGALSSVHGKFTPQDLIQMASSEDCEIQELVRRSDFNLQDITTAHNLYYETFGFNLQNHLNETGNRGAIERNIQFRHKIIHEAVDVSILNVDRFPSQDPIFSNTDYGEEVIAVFAEVIDELHDETEDTIQV